MEVENLIPQKWNDCVIERFFCRMLGSFCIPQCASQRPRSAPGVWQTGCRTPITSTRSFRRTHTIPFQPPPNHRSGLVMARGRIMNPTGRNERPDGGASPPFQNTVKEEGTERWGTLRGSSLFIIKKILSTSAPMVNKPGPKKVCYQQSRVELNGGSR